jgi:hypothetical protein
MKLDEVKHCIKTIHVVLKEVGKMWREVNYFQKLHNKQNEEDHGPIF